MATEFHFSFRNGMEGAPAEMERRLLRAAYGTVKYWDGRCEAHMKQKAPWRDRTTNARNGLFAKAVKESKRVFSIILAHSVTYGIYLEKGHSHEVQLKGGGTSTWTVKPYPIILPTIEEYSPKVMRTFNKILNKL